MTGKLNLGLDGEPLVAANETPLMRQYLSIKAKYPGTILLFRVGDFYETFGEDAIKTAEILGIVLTKRGNGSASEIELAGFPHHSLETYLPKLVRAGARVAVCDQLEDPKQAKGIVKRGVTEIVTPGIALSDSLLDRKRNNYLASVFQAKASGMWGAAFLEMSTGDFFCLTADAGRMEKLLAALQPKEVLLPRNDIKTFRERYGDDYYTYRLEDWVFEPAFAEQHLLRHFKVASLKGFGLDEEPLGALAAGVLLHYLQENEQHRLGHISRIYRFQDNSHLFLDRFTLRNLELLTPLHPDGRAFADMLDETLSPMGARLLRRWVSFPLIDLAVIRQRHAAVGALLQNDALRAKTRQLLQRFSDLERLCAKLATGRINPRECSFLRASLELVAPLLELLHLSQADALSHLVRAFPDIHAPLNLLRTQLEDDCPANLAAGGAIRTGFSAELDELRTLRSNSADVLEQMRRREMERTGISSLKVAYNKVFGYYIEITNAHKDRVPADYIRKQTLTGAERYITPELKVYEEQILTAEEKLLRLETELFEQVVQQLQPWVQTLQLAAQRVAEVDVLQGLAQAAQTWNYVCPEMGTDDRLDITEGRHPVIERLLPRDTPYIPNDLQLDNQTRQICIVTGPNMAGKSALLRQTALIVLMAQMGSYVPAKAAYVGLVDRIFTRVGASDNLAAGESTFMVEMNEAARILNNATSRSLILLDEIGRGTSTYDGVSIAWAIVEYLHNQERCAAKTLFATHYHELADLADELPRVFNSHVAVKEVDGRILFLRKLLPGSSEHSFGIQVAEMAGMPGSVVQRAKQLLAHFEAMHRPDKGQGTPKPQAVPLQAASPELNRMRQLLAGLDTDRMTPVEALLKLREIQQWLERNA